MADHFTSAPVRPHPSRPERHLVAVGIIRRHPGGRTITVRATEAGVTGTITSRCPECRRTLEDCTCTGGAVRADRDGVGESESCGICSNWTCTCPPRALVAAA